MLNAFIFYALYYVYISHITCTCMFMYDRTRRKTLKLRNTTNKDDYEAQTSIQYRKYFRLRFEIYERWICVLSVYDNRLIYVIDF